jgi:uncharacterized SAM-binding protein YcdF (DUF218 family)
MITTDETKARCDGATEPATAPRRRRSRMLWFVAALVGLGIASIAAFASGFLWFAWRVPRQEVALTAKADGIVVLTGGASRVVDAVELLASGHGKRLLITGVNRTTHSGELARLTPEYRQFFYCCIDLDHVARNTIGNAVETQRWTVDRGFRSLVIVTSNYHMPRAMAELTHRLPDIELIPFPVVTERLAEPWWSSVTNARLLLSEYVKYLIAVARIRLEPKIEQAGLDPRPGARS